MSQENVELVRTALAAFAEGDRERVLTFVDPECVVDATRNVFNPGTYVGIEGVRQMFAGMDENLGGDAPRVEAPDDRVVAIGRLIGEGKGSGVEVERFNGQVWTVREGRLVRCEIGYTDREAVLEAVGLRE